MTASRFDRAVALAAFIALLLFVLSRTLLLSSSPLGSGERQVVARAIAVLDHGGFAREAFALRHVANYRSTDNWWNVYVGHQQAYAATNFPFEVITLYPPFFSAAVDDVERAAILLHESQHLFGASEASALETVWRDKVRIGWTAEKYGTTRVWYNTREWTVAAAPSLFACGGQPRVDCAP